MSMAQSSRASSVGPVRMLVRSILIALACAMLVSIVAPSSGHLAQAKAVPHDFNFTHSAFMVNGKGEAYKTYSAFPYDRSAVVYKARIKGGKLYLTGSISHSGKRIKVKNKAYKLTSKTKYFLHVGNGSFYEKSSKKKLAKLMSGKKKNMGGTIYFILKKGKVTVLSAQ